jgi:hypothetical protein
MLFTRYEDALRVCQVILAQAVSGNEKGTQKGVYS